MEKPALEAVLTDLIDVIEAAGGIYRDCEHHACPVGDPDWTDLGDVYLRACRMMDRQPKHAGDLPEIGEMMSEILHRREGGAE